MALNQKLLEILVCPESQGRLIYFPKGEANDDESKGFLLCEDSRRRYRIEHGIPVMLLDESEKLEPEETSRLLGLARDLGLVN